MYTLYKFHFLNGISEINQLFDDILIIWPAPVYLFEDVVKHTKTQQVLFNRMSNNSDTESEQVRTASEGKLYYIILWWLVKKHKVSHAWVWNNINSW